MAARRRPFPRAFTNTDEYASLEVAKAETLQKELSNRVVQTGRVGQIRMIAGADTATNLETGEMYAAVVVVDAGTCDIVEIGRARGKVGFEYVPGLLSFREVPLLVEAYRALKRPVDLIMCDGHGLIHPRRFGLACHLGVLLSISTLGVGKTHLLGTYEEPARAKGSWTDVVDRGDVVGRFVRTRTGVKSVYVSVGHQIDIDEATNLSVQLATKARLPEPVRQADIEANAMRRLLRG